MIIITVVVNGGILYSYYVKYVLKILIQQNIHLEKRGDNEKYTK